MPLRDHFRGTYRPWESFLAVWSVCLVDWLNTGMKPLAELTSGKIEGVLPADHFAEMRSRIEGGQVAPTLDEGPWVSRPSFSMQTVFPDDFEVRITSTTEGPELVGVIALPTPGNKECPEARRAFAAKCAAYLHGRIGLVVADIVTSRSANLHDELARLLGVGERYRMEPGTDLYAVAYQPVRDAAGDRIETWPHRLSVGDELPILPLALRGSVTVPVDLARSYAEACVRSRLA